MGSIKKPPIFWIPVTQLAVLALSCMAALPLGVTLAYSLALGGLIHILPNLYFAAYALRHLGARNMPQSLRAFNKGEIGKFLLTMASFAVVFVMVKPVNVFAIFSAYILMLVVQLVVAYKITLRRS